MGHGAGGRNAVAAGGQDVAGRAKAGDVGGAGHLEAGLGSVGAAGGEIGDGPAPGGLNAAGGLGGQQRLVLDLVHDEGFGQLCGDDRARDFQDRLVGEEQAALGHGADSARETEVAQVFEEVRGEDTDAAQVIDAVGVE